MKVKNGFILRRVGKQYVVAATGEASKSFNGMMRLNSSGAYVFDLLKTEKTEEELIAALMAEYAVGESMARADVSVFISRLKEAGALV